MDISKALTLSAHGLQVRDDRLRAIAAALAAPVAPVPPLLAGPYRWEMPGLGAEGPGAPRSPRGAARPQGAAPRRRAPRPEAGGFTKPGDEGRARDANLDALGAARSLLTRTIDMLR